jgi:hypothetical protein
MCGVVGTRGRLPGSAISELIMSPLLRLSTLAMGLSVATDLSCEITVDVLVMTVLPSSLEKSSCLLEQWSELQWFEIASIRH